MAKRDKQIKAYEFLLQRAKSRNEFTTADVARATGWATGTVSTYVSKQWKDLLQPIGGGTHKVRPEFLKITLDGFLELVTQKRTVFSTYERVRFDEVVSYEFLLPLTREEELRAALDRLFFTDTIEQRLSEIGLPQVRRWVNRRRRESRAKFFARVATMVGEMFGGYSISHVAGRFRAGKLADLAGAAKRLEREEKYLIDETTAIVKFIIPLETARTEPIDMGVVRRARKRTTAAMREERRIRLLFLGLFAEPVARSVKEAEIWLLEEAPSGRRLYVWTRPS